MKNRKSKNWGTFGSLRSRLLFWFIVISLLPMGGMAWLDYGRKRATLIDLTSQKLIVIRKLKDEQLRNWMSERFGDIHLIASNQTVRKFNEIDQEGKIKIEKSKVSRKKTRAEILQILNSYFKNYSAYEELFIIDPTTGKVAISTNPQMIGENKRTDPYFTFPMKTRRIYVKSVYFSNTLRKKAMTISIPIISKETTWKINGVLVARLDITNSIEHLFQSRTGLGKTGETLLFDQKGSILVDTRWSKSSTMLPHIGSEAARKALRGETGIALTRDYRGKMVISSYSYIPFLKWGVISKQDLDEIELPLRNSLSTFAVIGACSLVLILIIAIVLARSISAPIRSLSEDAELIGQGNLSLRYEITTNDEVAFLGNVFNIMVEDLEKLFNTQKGIALVGQATVGSDDIAEFATALLENLVEVTIAHAAIFYLVDSNKCTPLASMGMDSDNLPSFNADSSNNELGRVFSKKKLTYFKDIPEDTRFIHKSVLGSIIPKELIAFPLIVDGEICGIIFLISMKCFKNEATMIIESVQTHLNVAFRSVLSHNKLMRMAEARKRLNKQLLSKREEVRAQTEELRNQNMELETQKTQLKELSRLKGEFLSNMSHELRTPLNSILTLSKVMLDMDDINGDKREYLTVVKRNGGILLELINNILELSKLEAGSVVLRLARFNVKAIIEDCVEMLKPLADEKGISIKISNLKSRDISNDPTQLRSILLNLIGNAIKFTDKGCLEIKLSCADGLVEIKVIDTGCGIPDNQLPHIFDEFRQIDGSSSRRHDGTGLGLAISKKAAALIGGTIKVSSKVNAGTCFTLSFPERLTSDVGNMPAPPWADSQPLLLDTEWSQPLDGKSILLVDDNEIVQIQVKSILKNENVTLKIATNGKEALDIMKEFIPDAIILDLMMPEINGFEVLNHIRATKETASIPVLILTAQEVSKSEMTILNNNHIKQFVQKGNIDADRFLRKIRQLVVS